MLLAAGGLDMASATRPRMRGHARNFERGSHASTPNVYGADAILVSDVTVASTLIGVGAGSPYGPARRAWHTSLTSSSSTAMRSLIQVSSDDVIE